MEAPNTTFQQTEAIAVLKSLLNKIKNIMMMSRNEIVIESLKLFHEMILIKPETMHLLMETVFEVIGVIKSIFVEIKQDSKEIKMIINKFIPEVLEIINDIFSPVRYNILNPNKLDYYPKCLFEILEKAIFYSKQAETFNSISPNKIITDDKSIYEFLEKLPITLADKNPEIMNQYFEFLLAILGSDVLDKFTDLVIRRIIAMLQSIVCSQIVSEESYLPHLSVILNKLRGVMCLRCDHKFLTLMVNTSKNSMPIWLYATDYFLKLVSHILANYKVWNKKVKDQELFQGEVSPVKKKISSTLKNLIQQIIDIYEKVVKNSEQAAETISKGIFSEIKKDWFEMDMRFINSIGEVIVPHFYILNQELLWKLINILDFTFSFYSKSNFFAEQNSYGKYGAASNDSSTNSTISKISLEILFKIAESYYDAPEYDGEGESDAKNNEQKRGNLARLATRKLLIKCKAILKAFIADEKKSGRMPLPRNRLNEIIYVFEKVKKLYIPPNSFEYVDKLENIPKEDEDDWSLDFNIAADTEKLESYSKIKIFHASLNNNDLIQSKKGHLIYFLPLFAECIVSEEAELKELLKEIFKEISKELGLESI
jgi:hypothetical protein